MDVEYLTFLRLLDDSALLDHIATLSQDEPAAVSTPRILFTRSESDPFNDGLDSQLLNLAVKQPLVLLDGVPPNQLAVVSETDVDESPEAPEDDNITKITQHSAAPLETDKASDEVGPRHEFGDFALYFHNKHLKQQNSDAALLQWELGRRQAMGDKSTPTAIFEGCWIYVNGHTVPSLESIHRMVVVHGGKFLRYLLNKGAATHIICDRLTPRKRIEFKNYKVVTAKWIADCVAKDTLLDWKDYRLIQDVEYCQKQLGFENVNHARFDTTKKSLDQEIFSQPFKLNVLKSGQQEEQKHVKNDFLESDVYEQTSFNEYQGELENRGDFTDLCGLPEIGANEVSEPAGLELLNLPNANLEDAKIVDVFKAPSPIASESGPNSHVPPSDDDPPKRKQYIAMDAKNPDFLAHFFANSRLHHLSSWKADLRAKFIRLAACALKAPESEQKHQRVIIHVDFDCFFATVSAQVHAHLDINRDPIAVSHGGKSSDVASCNYIARAQGVSNGMWLGTAMRNCPGLNVIDYDFDAYEKASNAFYNYFISEGTYDSIFPVLIDEVLIDATTICGSTEAVESLCQKIRHDIYELTKCSVSVGASKNVLLAKLAMKKAKPNGYFHLHENTDAFLDELYLHDLPGIGRRLANKLQEEMRSSSPLFIKDVKALSLSNLCTIFGDKTGSKVFSNCRGLDDTNISLDSTSIENILGRKSVSVDVNYGIRFDNVEQAEQFFMNLSRELYKRLLDLNLCGSSLTLRLAKRHKNAPINPPKYMGMGLCTFVSKSSRLGVPTNDWGIIGSEVKSLYRMLNVPPSDLRGVAITMTKLEDIERIRKQRQRMLKFDGTKNETRKFQKTKSQDNPFAESVSNAQSVDWDVFNLLPESIKDELKKELLRRGIPVSAKEKSPTKRSPVKSEGQKVYLQQLFPTQPNGPFKSTRVIETSKKKKKTNTSPTKSILPIKREPSPTPFNNSVSYDQDILEELPSEIRKEFYKELEWHHKNKKLAAVPMKEKFRRNQFDEKNVTEKVIDPVWLSGQNCVGEQSAFNGSHIFSEVQNQVKSWVKLSLRCRGPHSQDVALFENYIRRLISEKNVNRALLMLAQIDRELNLHQTTIDMCSLSTEEKRELYLGFEDWHSHFKELKKSVITSCKEQNIKLNI